MDQRTQQCKQLKKAYKKMCRRRMWWRSLLAGLSITSALVTAVLCVDARWLSSKLCGMVDTAIWRPMNKAFDITGLAAFDCQILRLGHWFLLGSILLTVVFGMLFCRGRKQLHRDSAYLDWRTLKTALDTEKKEL